MYSNYQDQDDVLNQLIFLCTDLEYRWKTATCVVCLLLILFWLLGRWRLEVEDGLDPDSELLKYVSSQIDTLSTNCLNSEELLKEIRASCVNFSDGEQDNKHNAYSSQSEDSDVSDQFSYNPKHHDTLSAQSSERDHMFLKHSHDPTSSESEEWNLRSGICASDYSVSTISITSNSPSSSPCPTGSHFSLFDEMSAQGSPAIISTVAASSKSVLDGNRQRQLWKRAILRVRIVVMLLRGGLKLKKDTPFQECRAVENICCSETNLISEDSPHDSSNDSFDQKRNKFEKYVKVRESINKQPNPLMFIQSQFIQSPVGQAEKDLKHESEENITAAKTDGALAVAHLGKEATDALKQSLKHNMGRVQIENVVPLTSHSQDSYDNGTHQPIFSELIEALEPQIDKKLVQHRWAPPKPITWSLKSFMEHQSTNSHGYGTKENITARRPHFCLRLEMANLKDNSSQEDSQNPNSPVKGRGARKDMVYGMITLGDISVEMTDKKISLSQQQISSAGLVEVLTPALKSPVKSASEPDVTILSCRKAKAQGFNKVALDPIDLNLKQEHCEQSMKTPTVRHKSLQMLRANVPGQPPSKKCLEEARALILRKRMRNKLEFNIKQKVLYQLWGLPLVVQTSLDTTMRTSPIRKDSKMLLKSSEEEMERTPRMERSSLKKWKFPKRIVKSIKTFEMPKAMGLKNLSLSNEN
ncbi:uncharacterized protein LOC116222045 [Clupea harengus]|uniref:Uncharacterized protein LOC116222045 n=1 Tax=Clupea harengus TaxID=7950 RepID=A0A6P8G4E7_CLUHA|nr:uncharacterized protein LOC116222045 [Clupea harengus]